MERTEFERKLEEQKERKKEERARWWWKGQTTHGTGNLVEWLFNCSIVLILTWSGIAYTYRFQMIISFLVCVRARVVSTVVEFHVAQYGHGWIMGRFCSHLLFYSLFYRGHCFHVEHVSVFGSFIFCRKVCLPKQFQRAKIPIKIDHFWTINSNDFHDHSICKPPIWFYFIVIHTHSRTNSIGMNFCKPSKTTASHLPPPPPPSPPLLLIRDHFQNCEIAIWMA